MSRDTTKDHKPPFSGIKYVTRASRSLLEALNLEVPRLFSLSDPPTPKTISNSIDTSNITSTNTMTDFAKASRDIRSIVKPFTGTGKDVDIFSFIAKFNLALKSYPDLEEQHKILVLQTLLQGDADTFVSAALLQDQSLATSVDRILDSLVTVFVSQKTAISRQNFLNSLKQAPDESVNLFASRVGIAVMNIKNMEYKSLANDPSATEEIRQAIDPIAFPDTAVTADSDLDKIRKMKLKVIRAERKREQDSIILGVFLRGMKTAISAELVKTGLDNLSYTEAIAKAMHIENSHKPKQAVHLITDTHDTSIDPPTPNTASNHDGETSNDIEAIAERVAQINLNKYPQQGFTPSFNQNRGNTRRGNRGRGRTFRGRGRGYSRPSYRNNRNRPNACFICKRPNCYVNICPYNPFNPSRPFQSMSRQLPALPQQLPSQHNAGNITAISAMEHPNAFQLPDF